MDYSDGGRWVVPSSLEEKKGSRQNKRYVDAEIQTRNVPETSTKYSSDGHQSYRVSCWSL